MRSPRQLRCRASGGRFAGIFALRAAARTLAVLAVLASCDDASPDSSGSAKGYTKLLAPVLEVSPPEPVIHVVVGTAPGAVTLQPVRLINTGTSLLQVTEITLAGQAEPEDEQAFGLTGLDSACTGPHGCAAWTWKPGAGPMPSLAIRSGSQADAEGADYAVITVSYRRPQDSSARSATLEIRTNDIQKPRHELVLVAQPGPPVIMVEEDQVRFDAVALGDSETLPLTITNVGSSPLLLSRFDLFGSDDFSFSVSGQDYSPGAGIVPPTPLEVPPGVSSPLLVTYAPTSFDAASAALVVYSNDPARPGGTEVLLLGSLDAPCVRASPQSLDFGLRPVGLGAMLPLSLQACGSVPVTITHLSLAPGSSPAFRLDTAGTGLDGRLADPLVIPVNGLETVVVRYTPESLAAESVDGALVPDHGVILALSDSLTGAIHVELTGVGVSTDCPVPIPWVEGDPVVLPGTVVQLRGDQSFAPAGIVGAWQWTTEQPDGSAVLLSPAATVPNPSVELDVVGTYRFGLVVWDEHGSKSCWAASATAEVVTQKGIHVEVVWDTPGDLDQTDTGPAAGSDLDLHFMHPLGYAFGEDVTGDGLGDGWFNFPYDCFWGNRAPNWGSSHPLANDDPSLDRDDADGAGPEIVTLPAPQGSALYRAGVHVFDAHGFGLSTATLRIYLDGKLGWEDSVVLSGGDLWDAAWIDWSSRKVKGITDQAGHRVIIPSYPVPMGLSSPLR